MALIKTVKGLTPRFGNNCYLAENATIVGEVGTASSARGGNSAGPACAPAAGGRADRLSTLRPLVRPARWRRPPPR